MSKYMPVKMIDGKNCVAQSGSQIFAATGKSCLIVTGKHGAKASGALDDCTRALENAGVTYKIFDEITENPFTVTCCEAGRIAREMKADFILGIGGGSALDSSKAVAIYAVNPDMKHDGIYSRDMEVKPLPVILVGTTAGTGSEVTGVSVLTNPDMGRKKSISGKDCYAVYAFGDYSYTKSAKEKITQSTALDAFAHATESLLETNADEESTGWSRKAIELIAPFVLSGCDCSKMTDEKYKALYHGSIFAGLAINVTGCAFPHTLGYYLTEEKQIPHGIACIAFMPFMLERAKKYAPDRVKLLEEYAKTGCDTLIKAVSAFKPHGVVSGREEAEKIAERWAGGVKNFDRSPGGFTTGDAAEALYSLK